MKNYTDIENTYTLTDNEDFYIDTQYIGRKKLEYRMIFGNENIVFIKSGAGGNARGRANKYLKMAMRIHKQTGSTVICASNPEIPHEERDEAEIRSVINKKGFSNIKLSFVGTSDGAYHNLSLAKRFPEAIKWLGINTSYINIPRLKAQLISLPNVCKIAVYGTNDIDFNEVVPVISGLADDNLILKLVDKADHEFTGMIDKFISLVDYLN